MRSSDWSSDVCSSDLQPLEPCRDLREQLVADGVPQRIVDRLEAVEVDHQQRAARFGLDRVLQRAGEILVEAEAVGQAGEIVVARHLGDLFGGRSEEHTSELQSLMRISYAVFCLKKKNK